MKTNGETVNESVRLLIQFCLPYNARSSGSHGWSWLVLFKQRKKKTFENNI